MTLRADQQAVIFDWNGTLLSDIHRAVEATNAAIALLGVPPSGVRRYQQLYEMPLKKLYLRLGCDERELEARQDEVFSVWGSYYEENGQNLRLRRSAKSVLTQLKERGHRTAILSNHTVKIIAGYVERFGMTALFDKILANACHELTDIMHKADKGSRLKSFVDEHDVRQAIVIGDSAEEIEIAHAYGFVGVGIAGGYYSPERLQKADPDFIIHRLDQLPAIVDRVFSSRASEVKAA
ncbi:MAG: HAD family hydrolase [Bdellovibrionales bacterium]